MKCVLSFFRAFIFYLKSHHSFIKKINQKFNRDGERKARQTDRIFFQSVSTTF